MNVHVRIAKMENNRQVTRFFVILGCVFAAACLVSSVATQSWMPLIVVFACVLAGLGFTSLLWALIFVPLFTAVGALSDRSRSKKA